MARAKGGEAKLIKATKALALEIHRKRLKALEGLIRRRLATVVESFYDIGEALTEILRRKLYAVGGHASLEAYLTATKLIGIAQVMKLIAIVREVPREVALAAGPERSYALIASGTVAGQPAAKAPVRAITAAKAERAKRPKTAAAKERDKADAALVKGVRALLRASGLGAGVVSVGGDEVRVVLTREQAERAIAGGV